MDSADRVLDRKSQQISGMVNNNDRPCFGASSSIPDLQDFIKLPNTLLMNTDRADRLPVKMPTEKIAFCDTYTIPHEEAFTQDLQYSQVNSSTTGTYEDVDENALVVMSSLISPVGSTR